MTQKEVIKWSVHLEKKEKYYRSANLETNEKVLQGLA